MAELNTQGLTAAELDGQQAILHECLEILVTMNNSNSEAYARIVVKHALVEQEMKRAVAHGPSNGGITFVQRIQAQKARMEQDMLVIENLQCMCWTEIQKIQRNNALVVSMKQATEQYQERSEQSSARENDEMEDESGSGPAKQKKWYLRLLNVIGCRSYDLAF